MDTPDSGPTYPTRSFLPHLASYPRAEAFYDPDDILPDEAQIVEDESLFRIAQHYLDARASLHLHLRVRPGGDESDPHEFCAVIASDRGNVKHVADLSYVLDGGRLPRPLTYESIVRDQPAGQGLRDDAPDMKDPMLVYIAKPRKSGKLRLQRAFSLLKGLDRLDRCPIVSAYAAQRGRTLPFIQLPPYLDWEFSLPSGNTASELDDVPKEIVKRGPQVVSELPDDQPDTGIGQLPFKAKDILAGVAIEISDDEAVFLAKEDISLTIESGQVLVRAFDSPIDGF